MTEPSVVRSVTTVGGCSFDDLLSGVRSYACDSSCLVDLRETDVHNAEIRLVSKLNDIFQELKMQRDTGIAKFYIGKTFIRKRRTRGTSFMAFDPMDPSTWKKNGISSRWQKHRETEYGRDGLVVLTAITRAAVPPLAGVSRQEDYALALEQKLIHHFRYNSPDSRLHNETAGEGRRVIRDAIGYAVYVAFCLNDIESEEDSENIDGMEEENNEERREERKTERGEDGNTERGEDEDVVELRNVSVHVTEPSIGDRRSIQENHETSHSTPADNIEQHQETIPSVTTEPHPSLSNNYDISTSHPLSGATTSVLNKQVCDCSHNQVLNIIEKILDFDQCQQDRKLAIIENLLTYQQRRNNSSVNSPPLTPPRHATIPPLVLSSSSNERTSPGDISIPETFNNTSSVITATSAHVSTSHTSNMVPGKSNKHNKSMTTTLAVPSQLSGTTSSPTKKVISPRNLSPLARTKKRHRFSSDSSLAKSNKAPRLIEEDQPNEVTITTDSALNERVTDSPSLGETNDTRSIMSTTANRSNQVSQPTKKSVRFLETSSKDNEEHIVNVTRVPVVQFSNSFSDVATSSSSDMSVFSFSPSITSVSSSPNSLTSVSFSSSLYLSSTSSSFLTSVSSTCVPSSSSLRPISSSSLSSISSTCFPSSQPLWSTLFDQRPSTNKYITPMKANEALLTTTSPLPTPSLLSPLSTPSLSSPLPTSSLTLKPSFHSHTPLLSSSVSPTPILPLPSPTPSLTSHSPTPLLRLTLPTPSLHLPSTNSHMELI